MFIVIFFLLRDYMFEYLFSPGIIFCVLTVRNQENDEKNSVTGNNKGAIWNLSKTKMYEKQK